jgi:hypothetical protein
MENLIGFSIGAHVASLPLFLLSRRRQRSHKSAAAAFAWVHADIGKYGGRKDRIFISGHSAGGHLVALLATDEQYVRGHKLAISDIRNVMPISGVYEIVPTPRRSATSSPRSRRF